MSEVDLGQEVDERLSLVHDGHMTSTTWAAKRTYELFVEFGITGWDVTFDHAKRRAGETRYTERVISLSRHFIRDNTPERVEQTIRHEIAHVLVGPGHGHDATWRAMARRLGHSGAARHSAADTVLQAKAWIGLCGCASTWERHRLTKTMRNAVCAACRQPIQWQHRS